MLLLSILVAISTLLTPFDASQAFSQVDSDCQALVDSLTGHPGWFEALVNPAVTSQTDIDLRANLYRPIHECLTSGEVSDDLDSLRRLTEYFLIFAAGDFMEEADSELHLVDLSISDDPAVIRLRDDFKIPAPEGYIFVRIFPSRQAMPELVRRAFEDEYVAGVTIFTRYVAVLAEEKEARAEKILQAQTLPVTLSHELVHAYINSYVGQEVFTRLPRWYSEGLAIYFSNSGIEHRAVTPGFEVVMTSPAEYAGYRDNFSYLEAQLGVDQFETLISTSLEKNDPSLLYQELGISSEDELVSSRESWLKRQNTLRVVIGTLVILIVAFGIFQLMPELRCPYCDYTGKGHDFAKGYCPNCRMPYDFDAKSKKASH